MFIHSKLGVIYPKHKGTTWLSTINDTAQNPTRQLLQWGRYEKHKFHIIHLTILLLILDIKALNMKAPHPFATSYCLKMWTESTCCSTGTGDELLRTR